MNIFPTDSDLSALAPAPMCPWSQCDHCYCQDVTFAVTDEPHKRCCKCGDRRAARFVRGDNGRART